MTVSYSHYLIPEPAHVREIPSGDSVRTLIQGLEKQQWIPPDLESYPGGTAIDGRLRRRHFEKTQLTEELRELLDQNTPILIFLPVSGEGIEEIDGEPEMITPACCDAVVLQFHPKLELLHPARPHDSMIPCPACETNLAGRLDHLTADVSPTCASCGRSLSLPELVIKGPTGEGEQLLAPFYRFALVLAAAEGVRPATPFPETDPQILQLLQDAVGVPFRAVGQWE